MPSKFETTVEGHVGKDPMLRTVSTGSTVCNFSVAVKGKGKNGQEETTWINVTCWNKVAEWAAAEVKKGMAVHLTGKIEAEAYADKISGQPRASLRLTAFNGRLAQASNRASPQVQKAAAEYAAKSNEPDASIDLNDIPF